MKGLISTSIPEVSLDMSLLMLYGIIKQKWQHGENYHSEIFVNLRGMTICQITIQKCMIKF
jgi:hypothetical protein